MKNEIKKQVKYRKIKGFKKQGLIYYLTAGLFAGMIPGMVLGLFAGMIPMMIGAMIPGMVLGLFAGLILWLIYKLLGWNNEIEE